MQELSIEGFRLSLQQRCLWQLQQANANRFFCVYGSVLIEGNLDKNILELALQNVVDRHEILRSNFYVLPGMTTPLQVIADKIMPALRCEDLSGLNSEAQNVELELLFHQVSQQSFDFEQGSLLSISLVALSSDRHILLIGLPALCADGTALKNLVYEISRSYAACLNNQGLADEPLQYADIAEWQNELFEADNAETGRDYWRKKNISAFATWQLPYENPPDEKLGFKPEQLSLKFQADQVDKLEAIAHNNGTSISVLLQTCLQVLLWRLTGQSDIAIGTYCDGRNYQELESALGLLAKYLPVVCHLEDKLKFSDLLKQANKSQDESFKWQETFAWEHIAASNNLIPGTSFFSACFEFEEQPAPYSAADVSFSIDKWQTCLDQFKIKLSCIRRNVTLVTEFHFDSNLFIREDIERFAGQFQTLLENVIDQPEAAINDLEILSDCERQQLLVEFNNTQTNYPEHQCIHQLFEEQVASTPDRVAVIYENQQLSYAQLNARANQLSYHLKQLGVGAEKIVALCVDRSLEMIIGLLGILKAGGAYLPLDPSLPDQRLAFMLGDAGASVILTQHHLEQFSEQTASVVCLDNDWEIIAQQSDHNPSSQATPENLVYVIYTSGSTGNPKGVAVEHCQLINYLYGILERLDMPADSSLATISTFAADLGHTAIFPALCSGRCLHVISQERATNPEALVDYFERYPIDYLKIVPSHLNALLSASHPEKVLPRRCLILGGEALSWKLVEKIQQCKPSCQIINHYGPTEATVGVLTYPINSESIRNKSGTVPLGYPIGNTQVYILDRHLRPSPIGVQGELYIGGYSLARGYFNQPALTTERFIHNPFSDESGARLYKTGDLTRYLPDGEIEFCGRIDHQINVHGFRIELGEIESLLRQHPAVGETVVLVRQDEPSQERIVAYIVPSQPVPGQQSEFSTSNLQNFLKQRLPDYMLPSTFVRLKVLPLTANGKVDRQALPIPESVKPELEGKFIAPRTPVEETIAQIWMQVLRLERVGIYDNFFELGGDSILSIQIIARANQAGLQLTPKQLFNYPTVAGLAAVSGKLPNMRIGSEQRTVTGLLPLTPVQHWFFEQKLLDPHHWNQALWLEAQEAIIPALLEQAVQHLLKHHDALRLRFIPGESGWQQVNAGLNEIEAVRFSCSDLSGLPAVEQEAVLEATVRELQASLNLMNAPLMRMVLFHFGDNQPDRLLWIIHHLIVDGISWRILLEDLWHAYRQIRQGETVQLSSKTTSFKQWSEFLQEYAQSAQLQQERDYWLVNSRKFVFPLPVDHPGGANTVALANTIAVSLSIEETAALLQQVPAAYQTEINDVLLTALVQTLTQWIGGQALLLDLEGHGRETIADEINLSRTIGWFTTIFPVLLTLESASQPGEALKAIKEQLRRVPNRGIGYGILRYLSNDPEWVAQLQTLSQAEVRFNYLGQFDQDLANLPLLKLVQQMPSASRSPRDNRRYLLDINGFVYNGQLHLDWTYSKQIHQQTTIENLAQGFIGALRSLIAHCQLPEAGGYTPSDFQKARLTQQELDQFLTRINRRS